MESNCFQNTKQTIKNDKSMKKLKRVNKNVRKHEEQYVELILETCACGEI